MYETIQYFSSDQNPTGINLAQSTRFIGHTTHQSVRSRDLPDRLQTYNNTKTRIRQIVPEIASRRLSVLQEFNQTYALQPNPIGCLVLSDSGMTSHVSRLDDFVHFVQSFRSSPDHQVCVDHGVQTGWMRGEVRRDETMDRIVCSTDP